MEAWEGWTDWKLKLRKCAYIWKKALFFLLCSQSRREVSKKREKSGESASLKGAFKLHYVVSYTQIMMYSRLRCEYHGFYRCCLCQHTKMLLKNINLSLRYYIVLSSLLLLLYYGELTQKICAIWAFLYVFFFF